MPELTSDDIAAAVEEQQSAGSSSESETSEAGQADAATTEQPESEQGAKGQGPIPFDRHEAVLAAEREKREELETQFAWARDLDPDEVDQAFRIRDFIRRDTRGAIQWLSEQPGVAQKEPPAPNLRSEDGQLLYSADQAQQLVNYYMNQLREEFTDRLAAIEQGREQEARASLASEMVNEAVSWPHFEENVDEVSALIEKAQMRRRPISLERAYREVVIPKLTQLERKKVVTEITTKAGASDKARPGRQPARAATKDSERPLSEILEEEMAARR